ncbi:MAG TPA: hypothetical protein PKC24_00520 [Cyclobacteriaceae bacterium]|nr:hypothetical protein [Cyclobacteriaceae bacterium]
MAQTIEVKGIFLQDSLKIGEAIPYALTARYPKNATAVFPDDKSDYKLFELEDKQYFVTKTSGTTSLDSAIYYLSTFEIDSVLYLSLPVLILHQADSSIIYPAYDSIFVKQLVSFVPDSVSADALPLLTNTTYFRVKKWLNTPLVIAIIIVLAISVMVTWIVFGKRIRNWIIVRKLKKQYQQFVAGYDAAVFKVEQHKQIQGMEDALALWKKYMERLSNIPFTKLTSKEIVRIENFSAIQAALRSIDMAIYAHQALDSLSPFMELKALATQSFQQKINSIQKGE